MDMSVSVTHICITYVQRSGRPGEGVGSPGLELPTVVSCHMAAGTELNWKNKQ